jgi:hypothetical protein
MKFSLSCPISSERTNFERLLCKVDLTISWVAIFFAKFATHHFVAISISKSFTNKICNPSTKLGAFLVKCFELIGEPNIFHPTVLTKHEVQKLTSPNLLAKSTVDYWCQ